MTNEYYVKCKIKLPKSDGALSKLGGFLIGGQQKTYEFEDGTYCEKCAKLEVQRRRNQK